MELIDKYEHGVRLVGHVDQDTLVDKFNRISEVRDTYHHPPMACADAGQVTYRAFRYVHETALYVPLVLREEGDRPRANTSNAAEHLSNWLRALIPTLADPGLTIFPDGGCTPWPDRAHPISGQQ